MTRYGSDKLNEELASGTRGQTGRLGRLSRKAGARRPALFVDELGR